MPDTVITCEGKLRCRVEHAESGAIILTDAPKDNHGLGEGFSPTDLLSASLGSCILSIMEIAAQTMGIDISGATATVSKEMANDPRRIVQISVAVRMYGIFDDKQRSKLKEAAYACPVYNALGINIPIDLIWVE